MAGYIRLKRPALSGRSFSLTRETADKRWVVIDANGAILGRLAAVIAHRLRGKHRPDWTPSVDSGDNVIVINAEKVAMTGNKATDKMFFWHTGWPGGIKERSRAWILGSAYAERVIEKAVQRMLPRGPLGRKQLSNLKVYKGDAHPHQAQNPSVVDFAAANNKNRRTR